MTIFQSVDKIRLHWLSLVIVEDFAYGLTNLFGKAQQPYQLLLLYVAPIWVWYGPFIVTAVLLTFGWSVLAGVLGTAGWGVLGVASLITVVSGSTLSYGAAVSLLGWCLVHVLIFFDVGSGLDAARERSQRRP